MIVVDTSVVLKCFFPENDSEKAKQLVEKEVLGAPDILIYEISNYLARQKQLSDDDVQIFLENLYNLQIEFFVLPEKGFQRVLKVARDCQLTSYDASFIVLAETLKTDFITADQKLIKRTPSFSFVREF